jgi:glycosyltransferase involved in cell wall biosynthesis
VARHARVPQAVSDRPTVSVVIPTRNRWPLLSAHALPSALAQEDVDLEVVVVDDGSTDETADRLAELDTSRVRVVRIEPGKRAPGVRATGRARNRGIAVARGEWLAFLDDDDIWAPRKLVVQLEAAERVGASFVYSRVVVVDEHKDVIGVQDLPDPETLHDLMLRGNFVPGGGSGAIARADDVRRVGGFDESLVFVEDWDLWIRLVDGAVIAACPEVHVARVEHPHGALFRERPDVVADVQRMLSKYTIVDERRGQATTEWLAWEHHLAGRRLAASRLYLRAARRFRSPGNLPPALGALLGRPGMRAARRVLLMLRGSAHFGAPRGKPPPAPEWLAPYRD